MLYRFGPFVIDTRAMRLLKDGEPVEMQQRVLEVLLAIVRRRGELITKEQLVDEVWGGEAIGDASLARCLYEARRALGDDARRPKYLLTVHGRGYRLATETSVEVMEEAAGALPAAPPQPVRPSARLSGLNWARSRRWVTAGLAIAAALIAVVVWLAASLRRPPPPPAIDLRVAILPISWRDGGEEEAAALGELLALTLGAQPGVAVRPPSATAAAALAASLEETARLVDSDAVVTGSVQDGEVVFVVHGVRAGLVEVASSPPLPVRRLGSENDLETLVAAAHAGAALVGRALARPLSEVPRALVPRRVEALRLYLSGRRWLAQGGCDLSAVVDVLEKAVTLDPGFAPAWEALAEVRLQASSVCLFPSQLNAGARSAARRARTLHPGSVNAALLESAALLSAGDLRGAWSALGDGVNGRLLVQRARLLALAGVSADVESLLEAAVGQDRLLEHDIVAVPELVLLPTRVAHPDVLRNSPGALYLLAHHKFLQGEMEAAGVAAAEVVERSPVSVWGRLAHALLARLEGDLDASREVAAAVATQRTAAGCRDAGGALLLAGLLVEAGDLEAALDQLAVAVHGGMGAVEWLAAYQAFEELRSLERFAVIAGGALEQQRRWKKLFASLKRL